MTKVVEGPPDGGFAPLVPGLSVLDLAASLGFWRDVLGFKIAYERPERGFAYLARGGAQVMLELSSGTWETGALAPPLGRGINFAINVNSLDPLLNALAAADWPLFRPPEDAWYRIGEQEIGQREFLVQDPDGYLLRFAQPLGCRAIKQPNTSSHRVEVVGEDLPTGFDALRAEALAEGFRHMERLASDWMSGTTRFDRAGEGLLAARLRGVLAGIGGMTIDPVVTDAFRMRRFYVRPAFRRSGIGCKLATVLCRRAASAGRRITVNANSGSVPFWESLGFEFDMREGHTHILKPKGAL
jgi:catechol 2,3-dioxygenase-like lactoylglutathione lyase family enzyme/GNAT superfamily N-acetyltransferase